jgi:hypothetical protein
MTTRISNMDSDQLLDIRVVITRPANDPALFDATVKSVTQFVLLVSFLRRLV